MHTSSGCLLEANACIMQRRRQKINTISSQIFGITHICVMPNTWGDKSFTQSSSAASNTLQVLQNDHLINTLLALTLRTTSGVQSLTPGPLDILLITSSVDILSANVLQTPQVFKNQHFRLRIFYSVCRVTDRRQCNSIIKHSKMREMSQARSTLLRLLSSLRYLATQGLAVRDHSDSSSNDH